MTTRAQTIDLSAIINLMILVMMMGMMMKMMTSAIEEPVGGKPLYRGAARPAYRPLKGEAAPKLREEEFYKPPPPMFTSVPGTAQEWQRLGDCITASGVYVGVEDIADLVVKANQPIYEWYTTAERSIALAERQGAKNTLLLYGEKTRYYKRKY